MQDYLKIFLDTLSNHSVVIIVIVWIMFDTFLGVLRAIKEKIFNSSFGIDGGIRKIGMIVSIFFLAIVDLIVHINLVGFLPSEFLQIIGLKKIGIMDFFGILFMLYETISILKNMYLIGIPMPIWLKEKLEILLTQLTNEIPTIT